MIITLASLKGGAGKTTLAIHLAHAIALSGARVLLVDADPQGSANDWAAARETPSPFPVVAIARDSLYRDLPDFAKDYAHVVIDSPPRVSALARSAILSSDLVLIPIQPSSYDIWAAGETVKLVQEAQQFKPDIRAAFVVNRKINRTAIAREVGNALEDYGIPTIKTAIGQRVIFAESSAGVSVFELEPSGSAAKEIKTLAKDVLKLMEVSQW
ncbi:ParA family partition ATPase [Leptolyngbya sp. AN02str]|uniref:ParA family partition ATPase n=1 Tax=Leptolyngbya sp. AN02str TaxID=3423363 RepID=UPI003D30FCC6